MSLVYDWPFSLVFIGKKKKRDYNLPIMFSLLALEVTSFEFSFKKNQSLSLERGCIYNCS